MNDKSYNIIIHSEATCANIELSRSSSCSSLCSDKGTCSSESITSNCSNHSRSIILCCISYTHYITNIKVMCSTSSENKMITTRGSNTSNSISATYYLSEVCCSTYHIHINYRGSPLTSI